MGKHEDGIKIHEKIHTLSPDDGDSIITLAKSYEETGIMKKLCPATTKLKRVKRK